MNDPAEIALKSAENSGSSGGSLAAAADSNRDSDKASVLNAIRTETALSRFPCHRIARKGTVSIEIKNQVSALLWEVTYNSKYGQPGPLAYRLDTLVINRQLDESGRPAPKILRLGSLPKIAAELGNSDSGTNLSQVRIALHQNASAYINAKIHYQATDGTKKHLEAGFNRYAVVFTGETLPDGRTADAVYLILSDIYREVLNNALTRPLDYDYMRTLPAGAQRFYEIVSYQIYAALKYQNSRARLLYSEYCLLSTATRYFDFDHVKKQMHKTHKPHLDSGYLLKTQYEATTDTDGKPDWIIYYTPGPNADREFQAFVGGIKNKRSRKNQERFGEQPPREQGRRKEQHSLPFPESLDIPTDPAAVATMPDKTPATTDTVGKVGEVSPNTPNTAQPTLTDRTDLVTVQDPTAALDPSDIASTAAAALVAELRAAGVNRSDAQLLAETKPDECRRQLTFLPHASALRNRGAYLKEAEEQRRRKEDEAHARKTRLEAQETRRNEKRAQVDLDIAQLEKDAPVAFLGFLSYIEQRRSEQVSRFGGMSEKSKARILAGFETPERRRELFEEWRDISAGVGTSPVTGPPAEPEREAAPLSRLIENSVPNVFTSDSVANSAEEDIESVRMLIHQSIKPNEKVDERR